MLDERLLATRKEDGQAEAVEVAAGSRVAVLRPDVRPLETPADSSAQRARQRVALAKLDPGTVDDFAPDF